MQNVNVVVITGNLTKDPELRQGLKEFSSWPTFPQLYVKGELVGGQFGALTGRPGAGLPPAGPQVEVTTRCPST